MEKKLLIIGAGGHGKVAKEVALSMKVNEEHIYTKIDFLDDMMEGAVGKIADLELTAPQYDEIFVAIGDNELRKELFQKIKYMGGVLATLIDPTAYVSPSAVIENGSIVEPCALINANVHVKQGSIVSIGVIVDHDALLEDFCHANTGTICCAGSVLEYGRKTTAGEIVKGY